LAARALVFIDGLGSENSKIRKLESLLRGIHPNQKLKSCSF